MKGQSIHFFDVDHTIVRNSTGRRYAEAAIQMGFLNRRLMAAVPFYYFMYRFGRPDSPIPDKQYRAFAGLPAALLAKTAKDVYESKIVPDLFPGAVSLIREIKAKGGRVVLATSSFDFIVKPLAEDLGAEASLTSSFEFVDGVSTGRFAGPLLFGGVKLERARAYAEESGLTLSDCSFYSDSIHDMPLLLEVGEPVAVNPDHRLAAEARARGWKVLAF
jgi:HAD superfamily hydrolase (TIGR01490 family)